MTHSQVINGLSSDMLLEIQHIRKAIADNKLKPEDFDELAFFQKYIIRALVIGIDHFYSDMTEVIAMDKKGNEVGRYKSNQDAAIKLGLNRRDLSKVVAGLRHSVKGYLVRPADNVKLIPIKKTA